MQTNFPWNERVSLFYASKQTCQSLSFNIVGGTLTLADTKQNMLGLLLNSLDSIWSMLLRTFLSKNEQPWNVGTTTDYWKITPLSILSIFFFSFFEELQWKGQYLVIRDGQRHFFPFFCGEIKFQYLNLWQFVEQKEFHYWARGNRKIFQVPIWTSKINFQVLILKFIEEYLTYRRKNV